MINDLDKVLSSTNIAADMDEDDLLRIGERVVKEFDLDLQSRDEWQQRQEEWTKLAMQVSNKKVYPWTDAANVKYPLLTVAALQFGARAYPSLIPNDGNVVKARILGFDPTGEKQKQAIKVGKHMSYQLVEEMDGWEEGMDKLLTCLPITGTMFKKTYYDAFEGKPCSYIIFPKHLVVNYSARCLDTASRVSEIVELYDNDITERQRAGIFRDVDLVMSTTSMDDLLQSTIQQEQGLNDASDDYTKLRIIIEQHCRLDLDEDGYEEPYIVTVDYDTRQVLRITARFGAEDVKKNEKGELIRIIPIQYYTKFTFIPNPDGGFYDVGFGELLGPINHTVNTIINQLIDAGTLSNLQSGFLGRGIKLKGGDYNFRPGEWKMTNSTGDDLRKSIMPMPVREPSNVLFQLLGLLIQSGKELSTVSEIMVGKMPGQNTPATTTMAAIEQGMKVFTAIYKRLFKSLTKEFQKLFELNKQYLPDYAEFFDITGEFQTEGISKEAYDTVAAVIPGADANVSSESQRLAKAQGLMELFPVLPNKGEVLRRILEAQEQPALEVLLQNPEPPKPSEEELNHQREMIALEIENKKVESTAQLQSAQAELAMVKAQVELLQAQLGAQSQMFDQASRVADHELQKNNAYHSARQADDKTALAAQKNYLDHQVAKQKAQAGNDRKTSKEK